ncbi:cryptococcal mannosyltransferase 1-domain-containing protein [Cantharellus anzutake]|uniref:cryptococcal mannosyltransferase 1-domain-containing protein n=1 Tax=Cantharellus anzutake TaxID=1750568 RepID=UPI0019056EB0|nr:cryptococcal mannosyltransferase 1-domain-containing protein [Cantharellus anzutake]KAF8344345.1 cryptococcal mannosyltransferase 1-domain-containing protein [Cantharellus anzutake]
MMLFRYFVSKRPRSFFDAEDVESKRAEEFVDLQPLLPSGNHNEDGTHHTRHHFSLDTTSPIPTASTASLLTPTSSTPFLRSTPSRTSHPFSPRLSTPLSQLPFTTRPRRRTLICSFIFLSILTPLIIYTFHFYSDPGFNDVFDVQPSIPHPEPVEFTVDPVSNVTVENTLGSLYAELVSRFEKSMNVGRSKLRCSSPMEEPFRSRYAHLSHVLSSPSPSSSPATSNTNITTSATRSRSKHGKVFIAIDLYNSAHILHTLSFSLLQAALYLGPQRVIVSIFENGSKDGTDRGMAHLAAVLTRARVEHFIVSDQKPTNWSEGVDRIGQLSVYRNLVIEPLVKGRVHSGGGGESDDEVEGVETVVFVNDVFTCGTDILELVHQRVVQEASAACGLDYRWRRPQFSWFDVGPKFYDNWVSRSLSGNTLRSRLDLFAEIRDGIDELFYASEDVQWKAMFREAKPTPVYSCWNGMMALDARPFLGIGPGESVGRRRKGDGDGDGQSRKKVMFRGGDRQKHECRESFFSHVLLEFVPDDGHTPFPLAASECKLIAKDFWNAGFDRWVLVPSVRVTYEEDLYHHPSFNRLIDKAQSRWSEALPFPPPPNPPPANSLETRSTMLPPPLKPGTSNSELIDWGKVKKPQRVVCWPYRKNPIIEWPWTGLMETA